MSGFIYLFSFFLGRLFGGLLVYFGCLLGCLFVHWGVFCVCLFVCLFEFSRAIEGALTH